MDESARRLRRTDPARWHAERGRRQSLSGLVASLGEGSQASHGDGYGDGNGNGYGYGYGDGNGNGYGYGYGYGDGNGYGYGIGYE